MEKQTKLSAKTNSNEDWLECAKWLSDLNCLPSALNHRLQSEQIQLAEFANSLRDGELLCNLINQILPGCIDLTLINKRAQMSQFLCLNNIRLFLDACKSQAYFGMNESDLFDEHMLYDLTDFASVIRTLSILSMHKLTVKKTNLSGFNAMNIMMSKSDEQSLKSNTSNQIEQNTSNSNAVNASMTRSTTSQSSDNEHVENAINNKSNHDDIYYNISPTDFNETAEPQYIDEAFLFNGLNNETVYHTIVEMPKSTNAHSNHVPHKRDYVFREILNTEQNFVDGLKTLMDDFLSPLSQILNEQDKKLICINIATLIKLHKSLYTDLCQACEPKPGLTQRVCNVFEKHKESLMKEYAEYFSGLDRSLAKCEQLRTINQFGNDQVKQQYVMQYRAKLDECQKLSKRGNFKLTDLLHLPSQRVLKYHLLFNELLKQTDVDHTAKDLIKQTRESMCEVGNYLNECKRDKDNLDRIEQLMKHLSISSDSSLLNLRSSQSTNPSANVYSTGLSFNLLKDYGRYIKDDKLRIKSIHLGERSLRTRTFFLFEKALVVCKLKGNNYNYKETLLINEYSIEDPQASSSSSSLSSSLSHSILANLFNDLNTQSQSQSSNSNVISNTLTSSTFNLNNAFNQHSLVLVSLDRAKVNLIQFKNKQQKETWKQSLLQAKDKVKPDGHKLNKHLFELTNFDRQLVKCCFCSKFLLGLFYQGYKCCLCSEIAHKDCLKKITTTCSATNSQSNPTSTSTQLSNVPPVPPPPPSTNGTQKVTQVERSASFSKTNVNLNTTSTAAPYSVKAIFKYDGRPAPPEQQALMFKAGDIIQVTDDDDDYWWKGFLLNASTKEEGFFPRRHVKPLANTNSHLPTANVSTTSLINQQLLEDCSWYSPVDRNTADIILSRIPNPNHQTIFMVRCRQEGGYAISIKYNGLVEHIKIHMISLSDLNNQINLNEQIQSSFGNLQALYSMDQQRNFDSIISLINYYCINSLKGSFPQLDSTLGIPFREALPTPISFAIALHDYNPLSNPNNTGEQLDLKKNTKYYVLNKESNGWWRVYNTDGLIGYVPGSYLIESKVEA